MLDVKRSATASHNEPRSQAPINPGSSLLREAIRRNIVSFPSQVPILSKQPPDGMQWRMVLLFFVSGWRLTDIAARFRVPMHRVHQVLNFWSVRALALGYVEIIDPEAFAECCQVEIEHENDRDFAENLHGAIELAHGNFPHLVPEVAPAILVAAASPPGGMRSGEIPNQLSGKRGDVIDALDAAISHCEEWSDEFWVRTATLLRDLKTVAVTALEPRRTSDPSDGRPTAFRGGKNNQKHELSVSEEEHVSHAVA